MLPTHTIPDRLTTDRFVLRSWMPGDAPALRRTLIASHDHIQRWMHWSEPDPDPDEVARRVREFRGKWLLAQDFIVGIWDPSGGQVLGGTGFHLRGRPYEHAEAEIGMWIAGPAANAGLGTAVLDAMLRWGFETWGWARLEWLCDDTNHASRRVAEKNGLVHEGTRASTWSVTGRRTTLAFALTAEAWRGRAAEG